MKHRILIYFILACLVSGCGLSGLRKQRLAVYDDQVNDCRDLAYDVFECRRIYGCTREMGPEECGARMLEVLNDPKTVDETF